jgi:hypothetical protein
VKKLLSLLICFGLVIGMTAVVGCGDDKKPSTTPKTDKDAAPKEKKDK